MDNRKIIRAAGIAGIAGTILMFAGDMVMYRGAYNGSEYMEASRKIMSEIPFLRLMIGGAVGPVASVLYCLGFYHVFYAIRRGSEFLAKIFLSLSVVMIVFAGAFHAGFVNIGLVLRAKNAINEIDMEILGALLKQTNQYVSLFFYVCAGFGILGTVIFLYLVLFRKTGYPKWIVVFTPALLILTYPIAALLPAPVGGIIYGGYLNISFMIFFTVSTVITWNQEQLFL